jgi:hypothetical protein
MNEQIDAYPLTWPATWPRTPGYRRQRANFWQKTERGKTKHSMSEAISFALSELRQLQARQVVISSNLQLRLDGLPRAGQRIPEDPGISVWFILKSKPRVLACDKWDRPEDNLWAIGKHIEALRGQERWGVGTLDQAFTGYPALPQPKSIWWQVLGCSETATVDEIQAAYRAKVKQVHPDAGGSIDDFHQVQIAYDTGMAIRVMR